MTKKEMYLDAAEPYWEMYFDMKDFDKLDASGTDKAISLLSEMRELVYKLADNIGLTSKEIKEYDEEIKSKYR